MLMRAYIGFAVCCTAGCATLGTTQHYSYREIKVTFDSDPELATLYESRMMGSAPVTLTYTTSPEFRKGQCMQLMPMMVRWISGVESSMAKLSVCPQDGSKQQFTFIRPDLPGREIDAKLRHRDNALGCHGADAARRGTGTGPVESLGADTGEPTESIARLLYV
jgi:hypothetical protein